MLKLERSSDGQRTTIRLIGRARPEHLGEITKQVGSCGSKVILEYCPPAGGCDRRVAVDR